MKLVLTSGDPAGIGPDIVLSLANIAFPSALTVVGDIDFLEQRAIALGLNVKLHQKDNLTSLHAGNGTLCVHHVPLKATVTAGIPDARHAEYVLRQVDFAIEENLNHTFDAMVTAPLSKSVINQAGISFYGHTEYLAWRCATASVMMLANGTQLRIALVTTHLPIREVASAITAEKFKITVVTLYQGLKKYCGLTDPIIGICGLNPHAGEQGHLGDEEINILQPVINQLKRQGLNLSEPIPADTVFTKYQSIKFDAIVAMFHDQALPVIKHAGFGNTVNVTLGLPFLRTSVDHGTAFELAGKGTASNSSLIAAINWTQQALIHAGTQ